MFMYNTARTHKNEMSQGEAVELVLEYALKKYMPFSTKTLNKTRNTKLDPFHHLDKLHGNSLSR